jgi:hypothetical protein
MCVAVRIFFLLSASTTGNSFVSECLKHSAKPGKHSVKALLSVTLGKESSANCTSAMTSLSSTFYRPLGKDFAECQLVLDKEKSPSQRNEALGKEITSGPLCQFLCQVHL